MWLVGILVLALLTLLAARVDAQGWRHTDQDPADREAELDEGSALARVDDRITTDVVTTDVVATDVEGELIDEHDRASDVVTTDVEGELLDEHDRASDADSTGVAGSDERFEARSRGQSGWGRLDVSLAWRHHLDSSTDSSTTSSAARARDELWLFATWRR